LFSEGLCNELAELYDIAVDRVPLPFPAKRPRITPVPTVSPPEMQLPPPSPSPPPTPIELEEVRGAGRRAGMTAADRLSIAGVSAVGRAGGTPTPEMMDVIPEFEM
jgi:hypothetical protein